MDWTMLLCLAVVNTVHTRAVKKSYPRWQDQREGALLHVQYPITKNTNDDYFPRYSPLKPFMRPVKLSIQNPKKKDRQTTYKDSLDALRDALERYVLEKRSRKHYEAGMEDKIDQSESQEKDGPVSEPEPKKKEIPAFGETERVYGNVMNIGIAYETPDRRVRYSGFRRRNYDDSKRNNKQQSKINRDKLLLRDPLIVILRGPHSKLNNQNLPVVQNLLENHLKYRGDTFRRSSSKKYFSDENLEKNCTKPESETDSSTESDSSEDDERTKNPGNPYSLFKEKYKQNWMWNFNMEGDHMNVNPYAPEMQHLGPSAADLFLGRKWWYFNQDDFQPLS